MRIRIEIKVNNRLMQASEIDVNEKETQKIWNFFSTTAKELKNITVQSLKDFVNQ